MHTGLLCEQFVCGSFILCFKYSVFFQFLDFSHLDSNFTLCPHFVIFREKIRCFFLSLAIILIVSYVWPKQRRR